jgi:quinol monooxygenase YgiN
MDRRGLVAGGLFAGLLGTSDALATTISTVPRYAMVGLLRAKPGARSDLLAILREAITQMPGCFAYFVNEEPQTETGIWITEIWDSKASHTASLAQPAVREAIRRGRPLIAGFEASFEAVAK